MSLMTLQSVNIHNERTIDVRSIRIQIVGASIRCFFEGAEEEVGKR